MGSGPSGLARYESVGSIVYVPSSGLHINGSDSWAALWRDEDRTDAPRIEFSVYHLIPTMALLTRLLADALDLPEVEVVRALTT